MGSDLLGISTASYNKKFQSTLPYGERPNRIGSFLRRIDGFNPRSRMGSDTPEIRKSYFTVGFNPRSRMGSDCVSSLTSLMVEIVSIHAPVWGATSLAGDYPESENVSIHAPVWGATQVSDKKYSWTLFQSTLPYGERHPEALKKRGGQSFQSTLPYWGATDPERTQPEDRHSFNPRSRMGSDRF